MGDFQTFVTLPQMHAIGAQPLGQRDIVVDDEGDVKFVAYRLQRRGEPGRFRQIHIFYAKLKGRDRSGLQRFAQPVGKGSADVERRNQVKLAGLHIAHFTRNPCRSGNRSAIDLIDRAAECRIKFLVVLRNPQVLQQTATEAGNHALILRQFRASIIG